MFWLGLFVDLLEDVVDLVLHVIELGDQVVIELASD
jgi:hypothetical protein